MYPTTWDAISIARSSLTSTIQYPANDCFTSVTGTAVGTGARPTYQLHPADLPKISVPALFLHGDLSHPAFTVIARALADGLPHARLHLVEGSGHVIYAERPDEFARAVIDFAQACKP